MGVEVDVHVGIDVGGTKLLCRATTPDGRVVDERRVATGPLTRPGDLDAAIDDFLASCGPDVRSVGVAVPGLVGPAADAPGHHVVVSDVLPHLAGWRPGALDRVQGCLLNDVRAALVGAMAERPDEPDVAVLVVGTGIATGFSHRGRVHAGADGWAGELGSILVHVGVHPTDAVATLDELASGAALLRTLGLPAEKVAARAAAGDGAVVAAVQDAGAALGVGLATLVCLVNPRRVVLAGGTLAYPGYLDAALASAARHALREPWAACSVEVDADAGTLVVRGAVAAGRASTDS